MNVLIRPESANRPDLMQMLKFTTTQMILKLNSHGVTLPDNSVKIWIKEFSETKLFPKVEFDYEGQELQYDLTHDGAIREAHFKSFVKRNGSTVRHDIDKMAANPMLIRIDNIIRFDNSTLTNQS